MGYWRYTLNELGIFDVSAQVDKIHEVKMQELGGRDPRLDLRYSDPPATPLARRVGPFTPTTANPYSSGGATPAAAGAPHADGEQLFRGDGVAAAAAAAGGARPSPGGAARRQLGIPRSLSEQALAASLQLHGGRAPAAPPAAAPSAPRAPAAQRSPGIMRGLIGRLAAPRRFSASSYDAGSAAAAAPPAASPAAAAPKASPRRPAAEAAAAAAAPNSAERPRRPRRASALADRVMQRARELGSTISSGISGLARPLHGRLSLDGGQQRMERDERERAGQEQQQQQQRGSLPVVLAGAGSSGGYATPPEPATPELRDRPPSTGDLQDPAAVVRRGPQQDLDGAQRDLDLGGRQDSDEQFASPTHGSPQQQDAVSAPAEAFPSPFATADAPPVMEGGGADGAAPAPGSASRMHRSGSIGPAGSSGLLYGPDGPGGAVATAGTVVAGMVIGTVAVAEAAVMAASRVANALKGGGNAQGEEDTGSGDGEAEAVDAFAAGGGAAAAAGGDQPEETAAGGGRDLGRDSSVDIAATAGAASPPAADAYESPAAAPLRRAHSSQAVFTLARVGGSASERPGSHPTLPGLASGGGAGEEAGGGGGGIAGLAPGGGAEDPSAARGGSAFTARSRSVGLGAPDAPRASAAAAAEREPYNLRVVAHSLGGASMLVYLVMRLRSGRAHHVKRLILLTPAGFHAVVSGAPACLTEGSSRLPGSLCCASLANCSCMLNPPNPHPHPAFQVPWVFYPVMAVIPPVARLMQLLLGSGAAAALYLPTMAARLLTFKFMLDFARMPALGDLMRAFMRFTLNGDRSQWDRAVQMPHYNAKSMPAVSLHQGVHFTQLHRSRRFLLYDYGSPAANAARYGHRAPPDVAAEYWRLDIPVDICAGSHDGVIPPSNVRRHVAAMRGAGVDVTYREFDFGVGWWGLGCGWGGWVWVRPTGLFGG
jgi:pimeloyl-ACP methyl ester carboxylesterase